MRAFADAYGADGGVLIDDWRSIAEAIDVGSMLGTFAHNEVARSTPDIERRRRARRRRTLTRHAKRTLDVNLGKVISGSRFSTVRAVESAETVQLGAR